MVREDKDSEDDGEDSPCEDDPRDDLVGLQLREQEEGNSDDGGEPGTCPERIHD